MTLDCKVILFGLQYNLGLLDNLGIQHYLVLHDDLAWIAE